MTDVSQAVREVLDRFCRGWEAGDADAVLGCFVADGATTVVGTDPDEYWRGYGAFAAPFRTMSEAFGDARYVWATEPEIHASGDVAWADGIIDTSLVSGGQQISARMRTTWTLRHGPDGWQVVQAHFSVAPNAAVAAY